VDRHASRVERTRALEVTALDLKHIKAAVAFFINPFADEYPRKLGSASFASRGRRCRCAMGIVDMIDRM